MTRIQIEPKGKAACPSCGVRLKSAELLAIHLSCSPHCREDMERQNRIQLLSEHGSNKMLILTDSLYLEIQKRYTKVPDTVLMRAVSVSGEVVDVSIWETVKEGCRILKKRGAL